MSIERIRNYIIENAKKEAAQLIKMAEEQFRNETESAKRTLEKKYQEILQTDEKHLMEDMKRFLGGFKSDCKMELLEVKNRVIDGVMERAICRIQSLPDNDYLTLMGKWLANIPDHLEGELSLNTRDLKRITNAFVDDINKSRKAKVCLSKNAVDVKGGFILKTRNYEIDYSLDTVVENLRTALIPKLNDMLQLSDTGL
ncbi:MAG TPA: V-type ATP synthase subunit E [Candidatus Wunengus sp. YC63]|uniref:V-type ATP synthase subunit E n=1 Tax=unclassified Candidatus Wunengus TaxID=3367695 RepID=UPI002713187E|nr:V-type ATP synthase subunit E [Candidatus Brocadiales bacterium]